MNLSCEKLCHLWVMGVYLRNPVVPHCTQAFEVTGKHPPATECGKCIQHLCTIIEPYVTIIEMLSSPTRNWPEMAFLCSYNIGIHQLEVRNGS